MFKVMTFNIRFANDIDPYIWDERKQPIVNLIEKYQPEIIGFQEVTAVQLVYLEAKLAEYVSYGIYRDSSEQSEMSPIFVKKAFATLEDKETIWLSETPNLPGSKGWDAHLPRVLSWGLLRLKNETDQKLVVLNTHLDHIGIEARQKSIELVKEYALELGSKYDAQAIITGDFNSFLDKVRPLTEDAKFVSIFDWLAPQEGEHLLTCHQYEEVTIGEPIDYIFVEQPLTIKEALIIRDREEEVFPSDHFPVMAVVE